MRAMILDAPRTKLRAADIPQPEPGPSEVLIEVAACGVCRTDLHVVDGELPDPKLPLVCGHQIVGRVAGQRVGVPWLGWTCGECRFCTTGRENLCDRALFTGYTKYGCSGANRYSTEHTATFAVCAMSQSRTSCIQFAPNVHPPPWR